VRDGTESEAWRLANGYAGVGFYEVSDLTNTTTRDAVPEAVAPGFPGAKPGRTPNLEGQLHAMRVRIATGDLLVLPRQTTVQLALGTVTSGYDYLKNEAEADQRHAVRVDWRRTDVSRTVDRSSPNPGLAAARPPAGVRKDRFV
jgi:restriction system protein